MEQDSNPSDGDSDSSLQIVLEETLQKQLSNDISIVDGNATETAPYNQKDITELRKIVCLKMHKAMSPISAISGYLELMKMLLEKDAESETLERYRSKVEQGVDEIGEIVEDLYDAFDDIEVHNNDTSIQSNGVTSDKSRQVG